MHTGAEEDLEMIGLQKPTLDILPAGVTSCPKGPRVTITSLKRCQGMGMYAGMEQSGKQLVHKLTKYSHSRFPVLKGLANGRQFRIRSPVTTIVKSTMEGEAGPRQKNESYSLSQNG